MQIMDLGQIADTEFLGDAIFCAKILVFKYILRAEIVDRLGVILERLVTPGQSPCSESMNLILNYLVSGTDRVSAEVLQQELTRVFSSSRETVMPTLAEQWVQQGREEGREEGIQRGVLMGSILVLQQSLGLPPSSRDQLQHQELQQLVSLERQLREQLRLPNRLLDVAE
jgi:hypothetical protein